MNKLEQITAQIAHRKSPPVDQWMPEHIGDIDIRIDANGHWFHESAPIKRASLVRLFASILWHKDGEFFLVTPVEKLRITVDDVALVINQSDLVDGAWVVIDNVQVKTIISDEHPVELRDYNGQQIPYVRIRYDLWARVGRGVYIEWVNAALERHANELPTEGNADDELQLKLSLTSADYEFLVTV